MLSHGDQLEYPFDEKPAYGLLKPLEELESKHYREKNTRENHHQQQQQKQQHDIEIVHPKTDSSNNSDDNFFTDSTSQYENNNNNNNKNFSPNQELLYQYRQQNKTKIKDEKNKNSVSFRLSFVKVMALFMDYRPDCAKLFMFQSDLTCSALLRIALRLN
jgi:hypothetical protein